MEDRFRPIYQVLYSTYTEEPDRFIARDFAPSVSGGARTVSQSIELAQERLSQSGLPLLREDAKFLLLTCFTQMVYAPLAIANTQRTAGIGYRGEDDLSGVIADDIWTIASSAAETSPPGINEISAHSVLNTLPNVWDRIKVGASRLWEG
jgi:hypothetical protein